MKSCRSFLTISLFLVLSACLTPADLSAQVDAPGDSDGRPGETNPVSASRQTLFRDDEVMVFVAHPYEHKMTYLYATPAKADLTSWTKYYDAHDYPSSELGALKDDMRPFSSARGRTNDHTHDYAVYAFFRPDGKVTVEQYDPKKRVDQGPPGRLTHWQDFSGSTGYYRSVDIALADLDGLSDANGWYHDEIVLVRTTASGDVDVDVIDPRLNSLAHETIQYADHAYFVSVDAGDLNGDGTLEFVVGMYQEQGNYQLAIYNFSNGDKGPTLTRAAT